MHFIHLLYFVRDEKETEKSGFFSKSGRGLFTSQMMRKSEMENKNGLPYNDSSDSDSEWKRDENDSAQ